MTEYTNISRAFKVAEPDLQQRDQESAKQLAFALKKTKEWQIKLEEALCEVFPLETYIRARPDVEKTFNGESQKIIEHFVRTGIKEIDIKAESQKHKLGLYQHVKEAAVLLKDICHEKNEVAYKTTESCLRNIDFSKTSKPKTRSEARKLSLLRTKGNLSNLKSNQDHEFAIKHTLCHYKSNAVCTWIPKNGCSNLRYSVSKENGAISSIDEIEWIHRNNDCFNANTKEALQADYTFIILRNPFKRLLSFFLDKLCHPQEEQTEGSYQHAQETFSFSENNSFLDFINYIWENPNSIYNDEHTRPQCDFLLYRQYDDYFALEGIDAANLRIYEMTGIKIDDIRDKNSIFTSKGREYSQEITNTTQANKIKVSLENNKVPFAENMYSNEMLKKVSTLYLQDILLYCNEIESDIPELDYWIRRTISDE